MMTEQADELSNFKEKFNCGNITLSGYEKQIRISKFVRKYYNYNRQKATKDKLICKMTPGHMITSNAFKGCNEKLVIDPINIDFFKAFIRRRNEIFISDRNIGSKAQKQQNTNITCISFLKIYIYFHTIFNSLYILVFSAFCYSIYDENIFGILRLI